MPSAGGAQKLDRLIHERLRLGILSALSVNETLTFSDLKKLLEPPMATSACMRANWRRPATSVPKIVRRAHAEDAIQTDGRPAGAALERYLDQHGSAHPHHAGEVGLF